MMLNEMLLKEIGENPDASRLKLPASLIYSPPRNAARSLPYKYSDGQDPYQWNQMFTYCFIHAETARNRIYRIFLSQTFTKRFNTHFINRHMHERRPGGCRVRRCSRKCR
jgi:hypothetical protein